MIASVGRWELCGYDATTIATDILGRCPECHIMIRTGMLKVMLAGLLLLETNNAFIAPRADGNQYRYC